MSGSQQLPSRVRVGYGVADFGVSGTLLVVQLYLFEYYTVVVGMPAVYVGLALSLALVWDAVSDPLMGWLCDRTRSRWGRFAPWMMLGAMVLPIALWILFNPHFLGEGPLPFAWLLVSCLLVNTGLTLVGVPHLAMAGGLSTASHERTALFGGRLVFGTLGLLFGVGLPLVVARIDNLDTSVMSDLGASRQGAAVWLGAALIVSILITVWATRGYAPTAGRATDLRLSMRSSIVHAMRNPVFLPLLGSFVAVSIGRAMNGLLALPFYKYGLGISEADVQSWVLGVFAVCIMLSILVWIPLGKRFGKKWPGFAGMLILGVLTCVAYPAFPRGGLIGPIVAAVIGGVAVGAIILFESMVTDVAQTDRLRFGGDREGVYFGLWRLGQKLANALGVLFAGWALGAIGFVEGAMTQSVATERNLAWLFGPGVGIFFIFGAWLFSRSPVDTPELESVSGETEAEGIL